jgi:hypothetical protein
MKPNGRRMRLARFDKLYTRVLQSSKRRTVLYFVYPFAAKLPASNRFNRLRRQKRGTKVV